MYTGTTSPYTRLLIHVSFRVLNFKSLACSTHFAKVACTTLKVERTYFEQPVASSEISLGCPYGTTGKSDNEGL